MRVTSLLRQLLSMKHTRVVGAEFGPSSLVVDVAPTTRLPRCSGCGCTRRTIYDRRSRTWRHLDFGGREVVLRYDLRRVDCGRCGTVGELVPWAEHDSRYTRDFEDHVAYLAQRSDQTTVSKTMRIAWRTVGSIIERVVARCRQTDLLDDLEHIGIDELSYRRHHEYLTGAMRFRARCPALRSIRPSNHQTPEVHAGGRARPARPGDQSAIGSMIRSFG